MHEPRKDENANARTAIIFDFDGTLTRPYLDFDRIRSEIGLGPGPILESLSDLSQQERERANAILDHHEAQAAENVQLRDDAVQVVEKVRARYPVGVLTRNARRPLMRMMGRFGLEVDAVRTREDGPIKPAPDGIFSLCREMNADPQASWMVGDYRFDLEAGREAGSSTILITDEDPLPDFARLADHVIRRLTELFPILAC